ncbi:MAG: Gfo/Idh/MocA family oxidoreductase [Parcubacteria group bacterium]|nr:Gfo/Idh/MocA family oxidoreductase [Parcubacteria group bacterium]
MSEKKLQVAMVGVGRMGRRWAKVASDHAGSQVSVLVDVNTDLAKEIAGSLEGVGVVGTVEEALEKYPIDAVAVATPHKFLTEVARKALEAGKHVFSEKPGGASAVEVEKNIKIAQEKGLRYMVAFNHRTHPAVWKAHELAEKGEIGKILFIRGRYGVGGHVGYEKDWRMSRELSGGGELIDQGVHLIDLSQWFLGELDVVGAALSTSFWPVKPLEDNAFLILKSKDNQTAFLHASWTQWKKLFSFEIFGEGGYLIVENLGGAYGLETLTIAKRNGKFQLDEKDEQKEIFQNPARVDPDDALYALWDEFLASIKEEREPTPSARDAAAALKIIESIYQGENRLSA